MCNKFPQDVVYYICTHPTKWYHQRKNRQPCLAFTSRRIPMACEFLVSNGVLPQEELNAYLLRAKEKYGKEPKRISIQVDGDEVALDYTFDAKPFERIRRITGYLVGTTDRFNNAKRAEEHDRVKHSI